MEGTSTMDIITQDDNFIQDPNDILWNELDVNELPKWIKMEINSVVNLYKTNCSRIASKKTTIINIKNVDDHGNYTHLLLKINLHPDLKKYQEPKNETDEYKKDMISLHRKLQEIIQQRVISVKTDEINELERSNTTAHLTSLVVDAITKILDNADKIYMPKHIFLDKHMPLIETYLEDELAKAQVEFLQRSQKVSFINVSKANYVTVTKCKISERTKILSNESTKEGKSNFNRSCKAFTKESYSSNYGLSKKSKSTKQLVKFTQDEKRKNDEKTCKERKNREIIPNKITFFNLTNRPVPATITDILNKGIKFTPTPHSDHFHLINETSSNLDSLLKLLRNAYGYRIDNSKFNILKDIVLSKYRTKLFHSNFKTKSSDTRKVKTFLLNNDLLLLEADKNLGYVLVRKDWYHTEVMKHLNDDNTYTKKIPDYKAVTDEFTTILDNSINISYNLYRDLRNQQYILRNWNKTPTFHVLPKIHKTPIKTRPVVPCIGSITANVAKVIDKILQRYVKKYEWVLKGTLDLIHKLEEVNIHHESPVIMSADVESLYTNIDVPSGIRMIAGLLQMNNVKKEDIKLIRLVLEWIFNNNYFKYNDTYYKQNRGIAMGSPIAPSFANLVLIAIERFKIVKNEHVLVYYRFIDDTFLIIQEQHISLIKDLFMNLNKHLRWTFVIGKEVPILDLYTKLDSRLVTENKISYETYDKAINPHLYTDITSHQPEQYTFNWIKGEIIRLIRTNSSEESYNFNLNRFITFLIDRNYPVDRIMHQIQYEYSDRQRLLINFKPIKPIGITLPIENKSFFDLSIQTIKEMNEFLYLINNSNSKTVTVINIPVKKGNRIIDAANAIKKRLLITEVSPSETVEDIQTLMNPNKDHKISLKRTNSTSGQPINSKKSKTDVSVT